MTDHDPALATVIASWPTLPDAMRRGILAMVQAVEPSRQWLTVSEAARLLQTDIDGLEFHSAAARVSLAANRGKFTAEGVTSRRRIEPNSFDAWRLAQRERQLAEADS